jgi:hypothetical protein
MSKMLDGRRCILLKGGLTVYLMDATWAGLVKLRVKGDTLTFWTNAEALR